MEKVVSPKFTITYAGKDISEDISRYLISVVYTDRTQGESDEVEITVEDSDRLWMDSWYPSKGDKLEMSIGYDDLMIDCGSFTVDEIELHGPPDTVTIRALAAGINSPLRSKRSQAHEDQTLRQIAEVVAARQSLTIEDGTTTTTRIKVNFAADRAEMTDAASDARRALGTNIKQLYVDTINDHYTALLQTADNLTQKGKPDEATEIRQTVALWRSAWIAKALPDIATTRQTILNFAARLDAIAASLKDVDQTVTRSKLDQKITRSTQNRETDLEFLRRIAMQFGVIFSVRGDLLIFASMYDIETGGANGVIGRSDVTSYNFKDKTTRTYTAARVSYHSALDKKEIVSEVQASSLDGVGEMATSGDTLLITQRVESEAQAEEIAKAALWHANSKTAEGTLEMPGRPTVVAGINIALSSDFGVMAGKWHVSESSHKIDRSSGYTTSVTIKRVAKSSE